MSLEPITTLLAARHRREFAHADTTQRRLLSRILAQCDGSSVAKAFGLSRDMSFEEFLDVPPRDYSSYAPFVEQTFQGDLHTFGHEPVVAFGETSGSLGPPKLIPHTPASLNAIGRFAERVLVFQLLEGRHYLPHFTKWLCVTASTRVRVERGMRVGFISGIMYQMAQRKRKTMLLPTPDIAAIADWDERIRQSVAEAWTKPVGTMLGVPAYLVRFLDEAARRAKGKPLGDVWPSLGRVYYSGTSIEPHRSLLERALGKPLIIRGLYTATEGSFGAELDSRFPGELSLMVDLAVFTFRDADKPDSRLMPAWKLTTGRRYEIFVTTLSGLIQYAMGDVLEVTETRPLRVRVSGRAQDEINLATEKLSLKHAHAVVGAIAARTPISREHFMVLPDPAHPRRHLWILERLGQVDEGVARSLIDAELSSINPSYAALRQGDAVLDRPRVVILGEGSFDDYVNHGFSRRGQFKFRHIFPDAHTLLGVPGLSALAARIGT